MTHTPPPLSGRSSSALPLFVAGAALVVTLYLLWDRVSPGPIHTDAAPRAVEARGALAGIEQSRIEVYRRIRDTVVHITSPGGLARSITGRPMALPEGSGSGFVWDERGYVVTNYHVVRGRQAVLVRFDDQIEYEAVLVGAREDFDIAVLKLIDPPQGLAPIPIGSAEDLQVGQSVLAIGSPFGLTATMTGGIVSALDRTMESVIGTPIPGVIQTDASINPGNSGGPLLDSAGLLIGMNTALKSTSGSSAGIGFAVPIDTINRLVPQIIANRGPDLPDVVMGFNYQYYRNAVMIDAVSPDSGAEEAGLLGQRYEPRTGRWLAGDLVLTIDGAPIRHIEDVWDALRGHAPGDVVLIEIVRGLPYEEQKMRAEVELSAR